MKSFLKSLAVAVVASTALIGAISPVAHAGVPGISSTSPATLATGVAIDANIVITFTEAVSAESGQITIYKWADKTVFESIRVSDWNKVSINSAVVTINPTATFANNTRYYVLFDSGTFASVADDQNFAGVSSEGSLNFTTVAAATTTTSTTTTIAPSTTVALPKIGGTKCGVAGRTRTVGGTKFVCKKTIRLVWRRA
jgi:methionine-rich copper-binding protein CopC